MISIREAEVADVPAIHRLIVELAVFEKAPNAVSNTIESLTTDLFEDKRCFAVIAERGGSLIGFALYFFGYSTWKGKTLYLEDIFIKESFRNQGLGQLLFDRIVRIAKENNVKRMDWQVLEWNTPAIEFYKKNNAILDSEWINGRFYFE